MARPVSEDSERLEITEGIMASLGNLLPILEMDQMRVTRAIELTNMRGLLEPVSHDIKDMSARIRRIQHSLSSDGQR